MRTICVAWPIGILAMLLLAEPAPGGTIRTAITTSQTVTHDGAIELDCRIRNDGDVTAHRLSALLVMAHIVKAYTPLGDNPAGGEMRFRDRLVEPDLKPGTYEAVLRVDFEEQTGKAHHVYHFFEVPYRAGQIPGPPPPVQIIITDPSFNRKAFWKRDAFIGLTVRNEGEKAIRMTAQIFPPEGLRSVSAERSFEIPPGGTHREEIPVSLEPAAANPAPYRLIVGCDHMGGHYSWGFTRAVSAVDKPIYFKAYLLFGLLAVTVLFLVLLVRKPPPSS